MIEEFMQYFVVIVAIAGLAWIIPGCVRGERAERAFNKCVELQKPIEVCKTFLDEATK